MVHIIFHLIYFTVFAPLKEHTMKPNNTNDTTRSTVG